MRGDSGHAPARGPLQEAELHQVGLVDVLHRVGLLAHRRGQRGEPHRAAAERDHDRPEDGQVQLVQAAFVHLEQGQRLVGRLPGDVVYRRGNFTFYFPLMTSILLSLVLSLLLWLFRR